MAHCVGVGGKEEGNEEAEDEKEEGIQRRAWIRIYLSKSDRGRSMNILELNEAQRLDALPVQCVGVGVAKNRKDVS